LNNLDNLIGKKVIALSKNKLFDKGDIFIIKDTLHFEDSLFYKVFLPKKSIDYFINSKDFTTIEEWRQIKFNKILKS
jgi:hypothetical protein